MQLLVATSNPHKLEEIGAVFAECGRMGPPSDDKSALGIELVSLRDLGRDIPEPHEDQPTFEGNAALKAKYYAQATGLWCLADDSGLEVDALGGNPGVRSARYAGVSGPRPRPRSVVDAENNKLLLRNLAEVPREKRTARFICAMALAAPPDKRLRKDKERGTGTISLRPRMRLREMEPVPGGSETVPKVLAQVRGTVEGRILLPEEAADPAQPHRGRGTNGFGYDPLFLIAGRGKTTAELSSDDKNAISHRGRAARLMWRALQGLIENSPGHAPD